MSKTVSQYKNSVAALLSGIDLTNVDNVYGALERAARAMVQKADIPEASGIQNVTLYSGVYDYLCDPRIFGTAINDIRPQGISRNYSDDVLKLGQQDFDRTKKFYPSGTISTFQYQNGTPIIRIVAPFPTQRQNIDTMSQVGTTPNAWVLGGTASNLTVDPTNFYQTPASLRMTVTGLGTGTMTKTLQSPISMANYQGVGVAFLAIQIPLGTDPTNLSTLSLKLGSNSANYSLVTASQGLLGAWVSGEWLLVAFDFAGGSTAGTPNWSSIQYVQVLMGTLATIVNLRLGGLFISLPSPAQILYQSAAIFLPLGGTQALTTITADTDTIILNDAAYTIYEYEGASSICQQTGGTLGSAMIQTFNGILNGIGQDIGLYAMYRGDNPSQELRSSGSWYDNSSSYGSTRGWGR